MPYTPEELKSLLTLEEFPRSAKYDPQWIIDNMMGPNVVWLAEAHALPFADGFFDAIVSLYAHHYFGTDDLYINRFARLLKTGGQIGIVVPGLVQEFGQDVPAHMAACWEWDYCSFHSPDWWQDHWMKSRKVDVVQADLVPNGWKHWLKWDEVVLQHLPGDQHDNKAVDDEQFLEMLRNDAGSNLGFSRVVAKKL